MSGDVETAQQALLDEEDEERNASASKNRNTRATFITLCLCLVVVNCTFSIMGPILPQEAEHRGVGPTEVGFIFSIFAFVNFAVSPCMGKALQTGAVRRKTLLVAGQVVCAVSAAAFGLVTLLASRSAFVAACLALRVVNGLGSAAVDTASFAIISSLFADSDFFGAAMGISESFLSLGWIIGPVLGGYAANLAGFAAPFALTALLALLCAPALLWLMPAGDEGRRERPKVPVTLWRLLRTPQVAVLLSCGLLAAASLTFLDPLLGPFLHAKFGWSIGTVGLCFGVCAAVYAAMTPIAGLLGDRVGMLVITVTGLVSMAAGYFLLGPLPPMATLLPGLGRAPWLVWASLCVVGAGAGWAFVPLLPAMLNGLAEVGIEEEGLSDVVSGLLSGAFSLGGGLGPVIGGSLAGWFGFEYAAAAFGLILLADGAAVCAVGCLTARAGRGGGAGGAGLEVRVDGAAGGLAHAHAHLSPRAASAPVPWHIEDKRQLPRRGSGATAAARGRADALEPLLSSEA